MMKFVMLGFSAYFVLHSVDKTAAHSANELSKQWVDFKDDGEDLFLFIDRGSINKDEKTHIISFTILANFVNRSSKTDYEVNCKKHKIRIDQLVEFDEPNSEGEVTKIVSEPSIWVSPTTWTLKAVDSVCFNSNF